MFCNAYVGSLCSMPALVDKFPKCERECIEYASALSMRVH